MRFILGVLLSLLTLLALSARAEPPVFAPVTPGAALTFPRDYGAHPEFRTEWWYVTGWVETPDKRPLGFQVTFFRSRTGVDGALLGPGQQVGDVDAAVTCCGERGQGVRERSAGSGTDLGVPVADHALGLDRPRQHLAVEQQPVGFQFVPEAGCLDRCQGGPIAVVYPEGVWYTYVDAADVDEIVESHLKNGKIVERLLTPPHLGR